MNNFFAYLQPNSTGDTPPPQQITQQDAPRDLLPPTPTTEHFDADADADDKGAERGDDCLGDWLFPDPAGWDDPTANPTPLDRLAMVAARAATPLAQARGAATPLPHGTVPTPRLSTTPDDGTGGHDGRTAADRGHETPTTAEPSKSYLIRACQDGGGIKSKADIVAFLGWQASRRRDGEEQKRFREDALAFPHLLVFGAMRKKSPFVHLVHSAGVYPNIPGADPSWKGKIIGFLGDKTDFAVPQMIELGKNVAWAWDDPMVVGDAGALSDFYHNPENREKLWGAGPEMPRRRIICPRMVALPPDCVAFCAQAR
jgi:hypothetical protein